MFLEINRTLQFSSKPVRDIIGDLSVENYHEIVPFIVSVKTADKDSFCNVWKNSLEEFNRVNDLFNAEEVSLINGFGNSFGSGDTESQFQLIKMTVDCLGDFEMRAKETARTKGKLKLLLPIYFGVVVSIILI